MKMNLKVLMLGLLIGCANFSIEALPNCVNTTLEYIKGKYTYVTTPGNWSAHPYYFGLGTTAAVAVVAGAVYLACKKCKSSKANGKKYKKKYQS